MTLLQAEFSSPPPCPHQENTQVKTCHTAFLTFCLGLGPSHSMPPWPHGLNHVSGATRQAQNVVPSSMVPTYLYLTYYRPPFKTAYNDFRTDVATHLVDFRCIPCFWPSFPPASTCHPSHNRHQPYSLGHTLRQSQDSCPVVKVRTSIEHQPSRITRNYQSFPCFLISHNSQGVQVATDDMTTLY